MIHLNIMFTVLMTVITLGIHSVCGVFSQGPVSPRDSRETIHPILRYPVRFVGKRDNSYNTGDDVFDPQDKRNAIHTAQSKLETLEKILDDLRILEAEQDQDFRNLLERHRYQLQEMFKLLPPYLDRRLVHKFLSTFMKRRFSAWSGGPRESSKRPSFNAWGGKRKRSVTNLRYPLTDNLGTLKRQAETMDDYTFDDNGMVSDKRPYFNAWGGKRTNQNSLIDGVEHGIPEDVERGIVYGKLLHAEREDDHDKSGVMDGHDFRLRHDDTESTANSYDKRGFNAWGGKRSFQSEDSIGVDKRASFQAWGGKRSDLRPLHADRRASFNAWGGKRGGVSDMLNEGMDESGREREQKYRWPPALVNIEYDTFYTKD